MSIHDAEQAPRFGDIAIPRSLVLEFLAGEFVEEPELPEHRTDAAHLEHHPLDGLVTRRRVAWQEAPRLVGEVQQDRAGLEQWQWRPTRPVRIDDRGDLVVRV